MACFGLSIAPSAAATYRGFIVSSDSFGAVSRPVGVVVDGLGGICGGLGKGQNRLVRSRRGVSALHRNDGRNLGAWPPRITADSTSQGGFASPCTLTVPFASGRSSGAGAGGFPSGPGPRPWSRDRAGCATRGPSCCLSALSALWPFARITGTTRRCADRIQPRWWRASSSSGGRRPFLGASSLGEPF